MESSVSYLNEARTGRFLFASWVRRLIATGDVIYAGAYSTIRLPGYDDPCVKVTFPLPNGNAIVVMRPQLTESKGLRLISAGQEFGEPGFYFTVHRNKAESGHVTFARCKNRSTFTAASMESVEQITSSDSLGKCFCACTMECGLPIMPIGDRLVLRSAEGIWLRIDAIILQ